MSGKKHRRAAKRFAATGTAATSARQSFSSDGAPSQATAAVKSHDSGVETTAETPEMLDSALGRSDRQIVSEAQSVEAAVPRRVAREEEGEPPGVRAVNAYCWLREYCDERDKMKALS